MKKQTEEQKGIRLNKFFSEAGICSRRQADRYVEQNRILIDGIPAQQGQKIFKGQEIRLDGKKISIASIEEKQKIVLAVNKPKGIVCTAEKREKNNIVDFIGYPERIYPAGRLDKDSEGLILMTNDGDLMNEILKARNYHEKEYEVRVNRPVTNLFLKQMRAGVEIPEGKTRPCKVKKTGFDTFHIILTQGMNRQIRKMCEALGYRVCHLKRLRIMNIHLGTLPTGKYREVTGEEREKLYRMAGKKVERSWRD